MQVILLDKVVNLGSLGEIVKVKDGFARNFLLKRKKALRATAETMPLVTVRSSPKGLPIATTQSPTRASVELPKCTKGSGLFATILSTARSEAASAPTRRAAYSPTSIPERAAIMRTTPRA